MKRQRRVFTCPELLICCIPLAAFAIILRRRSCRLRRPLAALRQRAKRSVFTVYDLHTTNSGFTAFPEYTHATRLALWMLLYWVDVRLSRDLCFAVNEVPCLARVYGPLVYNLSQSRFAIHSPACSWDTFDFSLLYAFDFISGVPRGKSPVVRCCGDGWGGSGIAGVASAAVFPAAFLHHTSLRLGQKKASVGARRAALASPPPVPVRIQKTTIPDDAIQIGPGLQDWCRFSRKGWGGTCLSSCHGPKYKLRNLKVSDNIVFFG